MALLELRNVNTYYGNIRTLKDISLKVEAGQIVTLIGANGAGKTTTLRTVSGLLRPRAGEIYFDGELIRKDGRFDDNNFSNRGSHQFHTMLPSYVSIFIRYWP